MAAGATATQAEIDAIRVQLGLDRPLVEQYRRAISPALLPATSAILRLSAAIRCGRSCERIPATLLLMLSAILVTVLVGVPAGVVAGAQPAVAGPIS